MGATLNVPRKVRRSGEVRVQESASEVMARIATAKRLKEDRIYVTEVNGVVIWLKHVLINSVN